MSPSGVNKRPDIMPASMPAQVRPLLDAFRAKAALRLIAGATYELYPPLPLPDELRHRCRPYVVTLRPKDTSQWPTTS